jgi:hypothetical protein
MPVLIGALKLGVPLNYLMVHALYGYMTVVITAPVARFVPQDIMAVIGGTVVARLGKTIHPRRRSGSVGMAMSTARRGIGLIRGRCKDV